jgi:hypothetical protein
MFKKFLVFLAAASLTFLLFATAFTTTMMLTFTPAHIKGWLRGSNVYNTIVDDILNQSKDTLAQNTGGDQNVTAQPAIQEAVKKAFSPEFLQNTTEGIIDGVTPWLEGKTAQPTFSIDVGTAKTAFAQNIASYARSRYASLPVCAKGQVPDTSDILAVSCQVPGVSIEPELQKAVTNIAGSKDFLPDQTLSASNLTTGSGTDKKPLFEKLKQVPKVYRWSHIAPYVLGVLALLAMAIVIFLSAARRRGVRRVLVSLVWAGAVLCGVLWLVSFGSQKAQVQIAKSATKNQGLSNTAITLLKEIQHSLGGTVLAFATVYLAVAAGLLLYLIITRDKAHGTGKKPDREDDKPTGTTNEPKEPTKPTPPASTPKLVQ